MRIVLFHIIAAFLAVHSCRPELVAQVAIDWSDTGMLITDAEVAGVRAAALVDTGHALTGVDNETMQAALAGKPFRFTAATGVLTRRPAKVFDNVAISIQGLPSMIGQAIETDESELTRMSAVAGREVRHVVGMSYLANYPLVFHPPKVQVAAVVTLEEDERCWPLIQNAGKLPKIHCRLGQSTSCTPILDTGLMDCLVLRRELAQELLQAGEAVEVLKAGHIESGNPALIIIRELHLCGTIFSNVPAVIGTLDFVGFGILRRMHLKLDFPNNRVIVPDPPQAGRDWFPIDASGIRIVRSEDRSILIRRLVPRSNGENSGLKVGDKLLTVDGVKVEDLVCTGIRETLSQAGKTVVLEIDRDGQREKISVPLSHPFEYPPKWPPRKAPSQDQLDFEKFLDEQKQKSSDN